jgi:hypothetical protein
MAAYFELQGDRLVPGNSTDVPSQFFGTGIIFLISAHPVYKM